MERIQEDTQRVYGRGMRCGGRWMYERDAWWNDNVKKPVEEKRAAYIKAIGAKRVEQQAQLNGSIKKAKEMATK